MPLEYRVEWSGTGITGPGLSVFHGRTDGVATTGTAMQALADRVRTFFDANKGKFPPGIGWTFPGEGLELDTTTGDLLDVHTVTAPARVDSTATSSGYSRAAGARVDWLTKSIVGKRRLRGRTFLVPMAGPNLAADGTLESTTIASLMTAATAYINQSVFSSCAPVVWSRTHGIAADITGIRIPDMTTILRSRRD